MELLFDPQSVGLATVELYRHDFSLASCPPGFCALIVAFSSPCGQEAVISKPLSESERALGERCLRETPFRGLPGRVPRPPVPGRRLLRWLPAPRPGVSSPPCTARTPERYAPPRA